MNSDKDNLDHTRRIMGALIRQPPKLHEDMKLKKVPKKTEPDKTPKVPGTRPGTKR